MILGQRIDETLQSLGAGVQAGFYHLPIMKPGDKIQFVPESSLYRRGLRTGRIISVAEPVGAFLGRRSRELEMSEEIIRRALDLPSASMAEMLPIVALDATKAVPDMPQGFQVPVREVHFRLAEGIEQVR